MIQKKKEGSRMSILYGIKGNIWMQKSKNWILSKLNKEMLK